MQIDKTQLDLFIRLQPFFKEKMGEFTYYDFLYCRKKNKVVNAYICRRCCDETGDDCNEDLIIPAPLDLTCSERCLWGMIKRWDFIRANDNNGWYLETLLNTSGKGITADNPTTAMLLALIEQEGIE